MPANAGGAQGMGGTVKEGADARVPSGQSGTDACRGMTSASKANGLMDVAAGLRGLVVSVDGKVATVTLDRPKELNIFNEVALRDLDRLLDAISAEDGVDVVLLQSSHPKLFTAGADINEMLEKDVLGAKRFGELGHRVAR